VATVVAKLFDIVTPDVAFFGEKDYQQLKVIERMAFDLNMPVEIVGCATVREPDGLAVSSRNRYLSDQQRAQATLLYNSMCEAAEHITEGASDTGELVREMELRILEAGPVKIDYVAIVDPETLEPLDEVRGPARICLAVRIGNCRLIDNLAVDGGNARR
jgi:pantoate--beta-alanine ligase